MMLKHGNNMPNDIIITNNDCRLCMHLAICSVFRAILSIEVENEKITGKKVFNAYEFAKICKFYSVNNTEQGLSV